MPKIEDKLADHGFTDDKLLSKEDAQGYERDRIKSLIAAAKNGDYNAALGLLFQSVYYLTQDTDYYLKDTEIKKLLQDYISECLHNCLFKPLSNPYATNELFANMDNKDQARALHKAFHLSHLPCIKKPHDARNYCIANDYFSLLKAQECQFKCKKKWGQVLTIDKSFPILLTDLGGTSIEPSYKLAELKRCCWLSIVRI